MAIPTEYRGIKYRSRLEARWASFFDHIGWKHTYEPLDGDGYIPDFLIHGERPLLVEVKPAVFLEDYQAPLEKIQSGLRGHWRSDILVVGVSPFAGLDDSWSACNLGLLGEFFAAEPVVNPEDCWDFAPAPWMTCGACDRQVVHHDYDSYAGRPCGHHDGDHLMAPARLNQLTAAWANACNDSKWHAA